MQNWVANTILKRKTGVDTASIVAMTVPFRIPPIISDDFHHLIEGITAWFVLIMFVPPVYRTVYRIVAEKENKVRESMRMMGLKDFPYWASWYTFYSVNNTIIAILISIILVYGLSFKTDGWVIFFTIWLYGQSLFGLILVS